MEKDVGSVGEGARVFLVGSSGFLGQRIYDDLKINNEVLGSYFHREPRDVKNKIRLDITDSNSLEKAITGFGPHYLINCAGMTSVDDCERRPEAAIKLNSIVPHNLADLAQKINCQFIHISTDHFSSILASPRSEVSKMIPVNQYGYSKLLGEKLVMSKNAQSLIIRTNFFGLSEVKINTLFQQAVQKLLSGEKVDGATDIFFNPIGLQSLSDFICKKLKFKSQGLINVAGPSVVSKFDFLILLCNILGVPSERVRPVHSDELEFEAPRPRYMALDTEKLFKKFEFQTPDLLQMIKVELKTLDTVL